jgi:hypothetical protein
LPVLDYIGCEGERVALASGYYTNLPLRWVAERIQAVRVDLLVRLDSETPGAWASGSIDPASLLRCCLVLVGRGVDLHLFVDPQAHAKFYVGPQGTISGSANLTTRGFGGGLEMVSLIQTSQDEWEAVDTYAGLMTPYTIEELDTFVRRYRRRVGLLRRGIRRRPEEHVAPVRPEFPQTVVGTYQDFLVWARGQGSAAAGEIVDRAEGKSNLQGHIDRNFHGLRQLFIAYPDLVPHFELIDPDAYSLAKDPATERRIATFVSQHATDESGFSLSIWKTYLPVECGGRAGKHGGTIGNLNRMLPLIARYLRARLQAALGSGT